MRKGRVAGFRDPAPLRMGSEAGSGLADHPLVGEPLRSSSKRSNRFCSSLTRPSDRPVGTRDAVAHDVP